MHTFPAKPRELPKIQYFMITVEIKDGVHRFLEAGRGKLTSDPMRAGSWVQTDVLELVRNTRRKLNNKYPVYGWRVLCQAISVEGAGGAA